MSIVSVKGAKAGDLPVQQPTTIPEAFLQTADEVIE
jgi:hypothetical protein